MDEVKNTRGALEIACIEVVRLSGDCPLGEHGIDLWDIEGMENRCTTNCDKYSDSLHVCWMDHFVNQAVDAEKRQPREKKE